MGLGLGQRCLKDIYFQAAGGDVKDVDGKGMLTRITLHNGASIVFGWKLPLPVEKEKEL